MGSQGLFQRGNAESWVSLLGCMKSDDDLLVVSIMQYRPGCPQQKNPRRDQEMAVLDRRGRKEGRPWDFGVSGPLSEGLCEDLGILTGMHEVDDDLLD